MEKLLQKSPPYLFALAALLTFALSIYLLFKEQNVSATIASGLFLVCATLGYLPQLESIKAFSIDIKLRRSLDRADELIQRTKELSLLNARLAYSSLAWQNRMGGIPNREKQKILDEVNANLIEAGVGKEELKKISEPQIYLIGVDIYRCVFNIANKFLQSKLHQASMSNEPEKVSKIQKLSSEWSANFGNRSVSIETVVSTIDDCVPAFALDEESRVKFNSFCKEAVRVFKSCQDRGGYTEEAIEFIERHSEFPDFGFEKVFR